MQLSPNTPAVGLMLREWRQRRRLSQLDLALEADISTRHLSFVETGRAQPSRDMLLHLAERLDLPRRDCNLLLGAAGFAPVFPERELASPALAPARQAVELLLAAHEPYPAIAVDRHWQLLAGNRAVQPFLQGVAPELLTPPINVLRLSLHPQGLAPRILNLAQWRRHLLERLQRQAEQSADAVLLALHAELSALPAPAPRAGVAWPHGDVVVPLQLQTERGVLSLLSTITVFGTPVDITLSELALETFFPADAASAELLRALAAD